MSIPRKAVLASDDLNARARVLAAADGVGVEVVTTAPTGFRNSLSGTDLLILDLDRGRADALAELAAATDAGETPRTVVGFVSHVDGSLARDARAAGCRAIARGRFWASLPEILGVSDPQ